MRLLPLVSGRFVDGGERCERAAAESIFRQILYGNQFFQREFGKTSAEYMLPGCFGFPASLPSILAHAGIKGFSTQVLTWNSANGTLVALAGPRRRASFTDYEFLFR